MGDTPIDLLRNVVGATLAAAEGQYCGCPDPLTYPDGIVCHRCNLRNEGAVDAYTERRASPHEFVPGQLDGQFCKLCITPRSDARHNEPKI